MVRVITIAMFLVACGSKATPPIGTVDADPLVCTANGGCAEGPNCGDKCCGFGEHCIDNACHCAAGSPCGPGDRCESAGPAMTNGCGSFCCGATAPCPQ